MADELGVASLDEAFAAALGEARVTPEAADPWGQSPQGERPGDATNTPSSATEHSDAGSTDPLVDAMLNPGAEELDSEDDGEPGDPVANTVEVDSEDFWEVVIDLGGDDGEVTIDQMADGYLRHADYTRKTQELAELRRGAEAALSFYEQYETDPKGFISALAVQAGLIDDGDIPPGELPDFMKFPTAEKLAEMVEQRARELTEQDPRMQDYEMIQARDTVNGAFDEFEQQYEMSIPPELRQSILEEAVDSGASDLKGLELVFRARLAEAQAKTNRRNQTRRTAPSRPGVSGAPVSNEPSLEVNSIEDAYALAEAQLMGR